MKTPKPGILLLALMLTLNAFAIKKGPDYDVEIGAPYKPKAKIGNIFEEIVGETDDAYYAMRTKFTAVAIMGIPIVSYDFFLAKYSKSDMALEWSKPIFPKDYFGQGKSKPTSYDGVYQLGSRFMLLCSNKDNKDKKVSAYAQYLDDEAGLDGDPIEMENVDIGKNERFGSFNFEFSADSTKLLVYYAKNTKKKEKPGYRFHIYDSQLEKLGEKDIELPFPDKEIDIYDVDVDNDGNVYALVKIKEGEKVKGKTIYVFKIYKFAFDEDEVEEFDVEAQNGKGYVSDMVMDVNEHLICTGFYGTSSSTAVTGTFFFKYDRETGDELVADLQEFDRDFLEEFYSEKQLEKADKKGKDLTVPSMVFRDLIYNTDGSCMLIGEQYYMQQVCYTTSRGTTCYYIYNYNDIVVVKISADGDIIWTKKIPKKSSDTQNGFYLSYGMLLQNDKLVFYFNDNPKNLNLKDPKKVERLGPLKQSVLVAVSLDSDGEMEKTEVQTYEEKGSMYFRPKLYHQISKDALVMPMFAKGKEALGTVTFKD